MGTIITIPSGIVQQLLVAYKYVCLPELTRIGTWQHCKTKIKNMTELQAYRKLSGPIE